MATFTGETGLAGFIEAKEVVVTTGAIRRAKLQPNHHHQQTNFQYFTGRMPFLLHNQQCQSTEGKYHISKTCSPQVHLEIIQLCLWPQRLLVTLEYGCHASHQPSDASTPMFHTPMARYSLFVLKGYKVNFLGMHRVGSVSSSNYDR